MRTSFRWTVGGAPSKPRVYPSRERISNPIRRLLANNDFRAVLILLLILNVNFFPCIWGKKTLLDSAQICQSILPSGAWAGHRVDGLRYGTTLDPAAAAWTFESSLAYTGFEYLHEKTIPLWNPYQAFGQPFAADMQSQPFYPLTAAVSLHITPRTYNWYILLRLFLAGIAGYFFARLFVSFVSALAGGVASMLAGYYLLHLTMPHLSVEILLPVALLAAEYLLRKLSYPALLAFVCVLVLVVLGGMPESSLLLLIFLYAYIGFRIVSDATRRAVWLRSLKYLVAASAAGLCLSAFLLLPLLEFLRHSFDLHQQKNMGSVVGLAHDRFGISIFTYVFPLLFGQPPISSLYDNPGVLRNEIGLLAVFFVLIAALCAWNIRPTEPRPRGSGFSEDYQLTHLTIFFLLSAVVVLLKRYGWTPINMLGALPLLRLVDFYKYGEPILSISVAMLCAIGLERIARAQAPKGKMASALALTFLMVPLALFCGRDLLSSLLWEHRVPAIFPVLAIGIPVSLLFGAALSVAFFQPRKLAAVLLVFFTVELSCNYILPVYWELNKLPSTTENPYVGAPYINWLKQRRDWDRVFARNAVLLPNWASAFQLFDIRDMDGIYYSKYLRFLHNFLPAPPRIVSTDLGDRFTGDGPYDYAFATPLQKRLLQLSSVRYMATEQPYAEPFQLAYNREIKIYRYDDVLPRAALFFHADVEQNESEVLRKLSDPSVDVFRTVLLDSTKLKPDELSAIAEVNRGADEPAASATIRAYSSRDVEIATSSDRSAILVLNDSDYPGWTATIDGQPAHWFTANYLFRAVALPPGTHVVEFQYWPRTFYTGCLISLAALLALALAGLLIHSKPTRRYS